MCLLRVYLYTHRSPVIRLTAADRTARRFPANYNPTTDPVSSSLIILTSFFSLQNRRKCTRWKYNIFLLIFFLKRFYPTTRTAKIYRSRIRYMLKNKARKSRRFCTVFLNISYTTLSNVLTAYSRIKLILIIFLHFLSLFYFELFFR